MKMSRAEVVRLPSPPVLITESADDFDRIRGALNKCIQPRDIIDQILIVEVATVTWEILRLQRCKPAIINTAFSNAVITVFRRVFMHIGFEVSEAHRAANDLVLDWFANPTKKENAIMVLAMFKLDESAIEAEAFKNSASNLEQLDRMLTSLESRRNRALRGIAEYRHSLARELKESSDRIIDGETVTLDDTPTSKPSAAA
jgi:hypothetical protein